MFILCQMAMLFLLSQWEWLWKSVCFIKFHHFYRELNNISTVDKPSQTHWLEMQFSTLKFSVIKLLVKIIKFNELIPSQISQNLTTVASLCNTLVTVPVQSSYDQFPQLFSVTKNMAIWQRITNVARQYHFWTQHFSINKYNSVNFFLN